MRCWPCWMAASWPRRWSRRRRCWPRYWARIWSRPLHPETQNLFDDELLATMRRGPDKVFRIARRVARDRVISTVDPDARHGHKTSARGFDGYKGHTALDPDSEII